MIVDGHLRWNDEQFEELVQGSCCFEEKLDATFKSASGHPNRKESLRAGQLLVLSRTRQFEDAIMEGRQCPRTENTASKHGTIGMDTTTENRTEDAAKPASGRTEPMIKRRLNHALLHLIGSFYFASFFREKLKLF